MLFLSINLILVCSIGLIISINPIYSILFLILTFIFSSFLLLLLNMEFFALIFIIIYVGAISVFFIFIIMMVTFKNNEKENINYFALSILLFLLILLLIVLILFDENSKNFVLEIKKYLIITMSFEQDYCLNNPKKGVDAFKFKMHKNSFINNYFKLNYEYNFFEKNYLNEVDRIETIKNISVVLYYNKYIYIILIGCMLSIILLISILLTNKRKSLNKKYQENQVSKDENIKLFYIY